MDAVVYAKVSALEKKINKVITITHDEPVVSVNSPVLLSIPIGDKTSKLLLKTIFIEGPLGAAIDVEIVSSSDNLKSFLFYKNTIATEQLYDLIDIPYVDEDGTDSLHIMLNNKGSTPGKYKVRISAILAN